MTSLLLRASLVSAWKWGKATHLPAELIVLCTVNAFEAAPAGEVVSDDAAVCAGHLEVALALCM